MSRDDQFMGFAKLLLKEMLAQRQWDGMDINSDDAEAVEEYGLIIARRAYDFACHIWDETIGGGNAEYVISGVTDMTTWPEEERAIVLPPPFFDMSKKSDVQWGDTVKWRPTITDITTWPEETNE